MLRDANRALTARRLAILEAPMMSNHVGPYVVVEDLARGGYGVVAKCRHERTGGLAAVKRAHDSRALSRDLLRKEVAMLSLLGRAGHPGVVRVLESGHDEDVLWYAMEYVDGGDLAAFIRGLWAGGEHWQPGAATVTGMATEDSAGPLPDRTTWVAARYRSPASVARVPAAAGQLHRVLELVSRIATNLAIVHAGGVVHGDLTPRNILMRAGRDPVLIDFGSAVYSFAGADARDVAQVEGRMHGTPGYMAVEQILGEPLDARCDLYALGCVFYELLTGRPPFHADSAAAMREQHLKLEPRPPSALVDGVPSYVDQLVLELLAKNPRERIGYAQDVVDILAVSGNARPAAPRVPYRPRMVGRQAELSRIIQLLEVARDGNGQLLFVSGESGAGKTRLVNEVGARALTLGMDVVACQCADGLASSGGISLAGSALHAFAPLLARLSDRLLLRNDASLQASLGEALAVLSPYESGLGVLAQRHGHRVPELPYLLARQRVFRSLAIAIEALADAQPLLIVIDDLHWADDLTLAFLQSDYVRRLARTAACILGTFRTEQVSEDLRITAESAPDKLVTLRRLGVDDVGSIARDMLAATMLPEGLAEFLHRHSEGSPFFAAEYLRRAIEHGLVQRTAERDWTAPALAAPPSSSNRRIPAGLDKSLQSILEVRLAELSPGSLTLLERAAILGKEFEVDLLQAVDNEQPHAQSLEQAIGLEELKARQVLEPVTPTRYRFAHDKLREACELRIPEERRRALHGAVARRLENVLAGNDARERTDARVGIHWAQAGDPKRAFPYLERAAGHAESVYAVREAMELYALAIAQGDAAGVEIHRLRRLGEGAADLLTRQARHAEACALIDWTLSRTPDDERLTAARLRRKRAQSCWTVHRYELAKRSLDQASEALGAPSELQTLDQRREWIEIQLGYFWRAYFARETGPVTQAIIQRMADVTVSAGTPVQQSAYHVCAGLDILGRGRYVYSAKAVDFMRQALVLLEPLPAFPVDAALARFNLGFALLLGRKAARREAIDQLEQTATAAERFGDATLRARALTYLAIAHRRMSDASNAERVANQALVAADSAQLRPYLAAATACLAWVHLTKGDDDRAVQLSEMARRWWKEGDHSFPFCWLANLPLLEVYVRRGYLEASDQLVLALLAPQQQQLPAPVRVGLKNAARARAAQRSDAWSQYERALAVAQGFGYR